MLDGIVMRQTARTLQLQ